MANSSKPYPLPLPIVTLRVLGMGRLFCLMKGEKIRPIHFCSLDRVPQSPIIISSMANWLERFLGKREGESASSSSGWTDEFPRANVAAEQAFEVRKDQQNKIEARKEAERRPTIESKASELNRSARSMRQWIEGAIRQAITEGKTKLYFKNLISVHSFFEISSNERREIEFILNKSINSASELQSLLLYLNSKGYRASAFVHSGLSFHRIGVWLGIDWEPVDPY